VIDVRKPGSLAKNRGMSPRVQAAQTIIAPPRFPVGRSLASALAWLK
jgi:hypothetical protein